MPPLRPSRIGRSIPAGSFWWPRHVVLLHRAPARATFRAHARSASTPRGIPQPGGRERDSWLHNDAHNPSPRPAGGRKRLGLHRATVNEMVHDGRLAVRREGPWWTVSERDFERLARTYRRPPNAGRNERHPVPSHRRKFLSCCTNGLREFCRVGGSVTDAHRKYPQASPTSRGGPRSAVTTANGDLLTPGKAPFERVSSPQLGG